MEDKTESQVAWNTAYLRVGLLLCLTLFLLFACLGALVMIPG